MKARRAIRGMLGLVLGLILLVAAVVTVALSSERIGRRVIASVLSRPGMPVTIREVHGPLGGPLLLVGVDYRSPAMRATIDSVRLEWSPSQLLALRARITRLAVHGVAVVMSDATPPDTAALPAERQRITSPIAVWIDTAFVRGIRVDAADSIRFTEGAADLSGTLDDYRLTLRGTATHPRSGAVPVRLQARGNLDALRESAIEALVFDGAVRSTGTVRWWPEIGWDLRLTADGIRPAALLRDSASLPGRVHAWLGSTGRLDPAGPSGQLVLDSLGGALRGQPLAGQGTIMFAGTAFDIDTLLVRWGSVEGHAAGRVADSLALAWRVTAGDLATIVPGSGGSLHAEGVAHGPRAAAIVDATLDGRSLRMGTNSVRSVSGRASVGMAPDGVLTLEVRGSGGSVSGRAVDRVLLRIDGTRLAHRARAEAVAPADSLWLALRGGWRDAAWSGRIEELTVGSAQGGRWALERAAALRAGAISARLDTLCVAADSTRGRACAAGDWTPRRWNAVADLRGVPVASLPLMPLDSLTRGRGRFGGTLGAHLEAHADAGRLEATLRGASDTVAFIYQAGGDTTTRRLALDTATVDVRVDHDGMAATMAFRIVGDDGNPLADLHGEATLPRYRLGDPFTGQPLTATLKGRSEEIGFARPLLRRVDSLGGSVTLDVAVEGTIDNPSGTGTAQLEHFVVALDDGREVGGDFALDITGRMDADRRISGKAALVPTGLYYDYGAGTPGGNRLLLSGEGVLVEIADRGLRGSVDLRAFQRQGGSQGTLTAALVLPQYTGPGQAIATQPVTLSVELDVPDLSLFQPMVPAVDSLAGRMHGTLAMSGRIGAPEVRGEFRLQDGRGLLPFGTLVEGGFNGTVTASEAADGTAIASLSILPDSLRLRYDAGRAVETLSFGGSRIEAHAGTDGLRGALAVRLSSGRGTLLATVDGRAAVPEFRRWDAPLAPLAVEGTVTGRADDLAFLPAFSPQVDSAAGTLAFAGRLAGTAEKTRLSGELTLTDGAARIPMLGILVRDAAFTARGDQDEAISIDGSMRSGGGQLTIRGRTPLAPTPADPGRVAIRGERFEALGMPEMRAVLSPSLDVRLVGDSIAVTGEVRVPLARLVMNEIPRTAIPPSDDIVIVDSMATSRAPRPLSAEVRVVLGDSVSFQGFNFNAELGGSVVIRQRPEQLPTGTGTLILEEGTYQAYGQDLTIRDGAVRFAGGRVDNPGIDMRATRTADDGTVAGLDVNGTLRTPRVTLYSEPPMAQSEILSYILTGRATGQSSPAKGNLIARAINSLGLRGSNALAGTIGKGIGLDEARIETESDIRGASFVAGRFLSPGLYVSYGIGLFDPFSTLRLRYMLSNNFSLEAVTGKVTGADVKVRIEGP